MEQFEEQISSLMDYQSEAGAPFTAADISAGARRRGRQRMFTATASALAVAAVGVGAVTVAGGGKPGGAATVTADSGGTAVATSASAAPTQAVVPVRRVSPVQTVEPGAEIEVAPGFRLSVTSHTKCDTISSPFENLPAGSAPAKQCKDVDDGNFGPRTEASVGYQGTGGKVDYVLAGEYIGPVAASLIDVVYDGVHYTATIVKTDGMDRWFTWYVDLPGRSDHVVGKDGKDGKQTMDRASVTAYDAAGKVLADMPSPGTAPASGAAGGSSGSGGSGLLGGPGGPATSPSPTQGK